MTLVLEAKGLCPQVADQQQSLPALNLSLNAHQCCCLIGSRVEIREAYLRALAGLDMPAAGELVLLGRDQEALTEQGLDYLGRELGYVARQAPLLSVLNGQENAVMPAVYHGQKRAAALAELELLLQELNFTGDLKCLPALLPELEKMQLALARAALLAPQLLFLEDPWQALDLTESALLEQSLERWSQRMALVVATAHLGFVRQQADEIVFLGTEQCFNFSNWLDLVSSDQPEIQQYLDRYRAAIDWKV